MHTSFADLRAVEEQLQIIKTAVKHSPPEGVPSKDWRTYSHFSAITRLYALYESFTKQIIVSWLARLPSYVKTYNSLDDRIKDEHMKGVARVMISVNGDSERALRTLHEGLCGTEKYSLYSDAFTHHRKNFRKDMLLEIFSRIAINDLWDWITSYPIVKDFFEDRAGSVSGAQLSKLLENEIKNFIEYRNEAAHGIVINQTLGDREIDSYANLINALCHAIADRLTYEQLRHEEQSGLAVNVGRITEHYKKKSAYIVTCDAGLSEKISRRSVVYLEGKPFCKQARVVSIQDNDVSVDSVQLSAGKEIGLKFDTMGATKGMNLYVIGAVDRPA